MRWGKIGTGLAIAFLATTASAETTIRAFYAPADKAIHKALTAASLLLQAERERVTDTQELLASSRAEYARLLGVLYQRGYYGATISVLVDGQEASDIPPLAAPETIDRIELRVNPGPLYRFDRTDIGPLAPGTETPEEYRRGQPGGIRAIREAADAAILEWRRDGHAKADVSDQRIIARHDVRQVSADVVIAPGPKLNFGMVTISGNKDVRTNRIRTIAGLEPGTQFDPDEVARAERRLRRTGSFRSVVLREAEAANPDGTLPMAIEVVEQTPRRFGFGAEYSTVDGATLSGFWLHRNFLGGAERFRVDGEIAGVAGETGGIDLSFNVRYERPATPRADVDLFTEYGFEKLKEPDFESTTSEFTLGFTRYATDELTVNFGLGYLYSETEDALGTETWSLVTLPLGATLDRRDNPLNPTRGVFVALDSTPFYGISDSPSGAEARLDMRGYKTIASARPVTAALRLQFGSVIGPALEDTPPFYRFYSGGGGTVRGQDYQSLGVDLGGGDRTGGRSFAGVSAEARIGVTDTIQLVGFYDWGYVGPESFPDGSGDSHSGAGLGLRYNTGIGPIRLDVATPVSGKADASSYYIYVGIGQAF